MVAFFGGTVIGAFIGVLVLALFIAAKDADQKAEDLTKRGKLYSAGEVREPPLA